MSQPGKRAARNGPETPPIGRFLAGPWTVDYKALNRLSGTLSEEAAAASARAAAWTALDFILEMAAVGPSGHADALIASKHHSIHGDYEDNLVIACAMRANARLLVTNDNKLIRHSPLSTMCAEDVARLLALE